VVRTRGAISRPRPRNGPGPTQGVERRGAYSIEREKEPTETECRSLSKDIFDTAICDRATVRRFYTGWRQANDFRAAAFDRGRRALLPQKTVTTKFAKTAILGRPPIRHDADLHSRGGSSRFGGGGRPTSWCPSRSAPDGGSVIRPAAYCGVVGFQPRLGLFPTAGMRLINTETLDTVGIMARSVGVSTVPGGGDGDPLHPAGDAGDGTPPRSCHASIGRTASRKAAPVARSGADPSPLPAPLT